MEIKRLGDYVKIKTGKLDANANDENGEYPFFTCSINNLWINTYAYDCECILIAGNGDLNVKYYSGKFNAYQRTYIVESLDKQVLDTRYLYYFMNKYIDVLRNNSIGGVIKYIKLGNLTKALIPLPPLETQKKIVAVLDKAQALIDARKAQITLLDDLIQSVFYKMFGDPVTNPKGWEKQRLDTIGTFKNGMNFSSSDYGHSINCVGVGDFKSLYKLDKTEHLSKINLDKLPTEEYLLRDGDVVFVRSNGNKALVGRSMLVYPGNVLTTFSGFCIRLRLTSEKVLQGYLIHFLHSKSSKEQLLRHGRGANITNINQKMLSEMRILIPPINQQTLFNERIEHIESQKQLYQQSLTDLETNFNSLMQKSFNGELFS